MIRLTREQRAVFYEEAAREAHGAAGDVALMLEKRGGEHARRCNQRYQAAAAILDDLGWEKDDPRAEFTVTIDPAQWREWVLEIAASAGDTLHGLTAELNDPGRHRLHPPEHHAELDESTREAIGREGRVVRACAHALIEVPA
ncbi:MAG TPA: hypothetical protein VF533_17435 [Solirubrobacteraceae bacterium]|jgi:hypothetical protein